MAKPRRPRKTLRADARALLLASAGWASRRAARRIAQAIDRDLARRGRKLGLSRLGLAQLGLAQLGLLAEIAALDDDSLGALARRAGLDQSTLSRNLRTLEKAGLVEIAVVEKDLRRRAVWLTEAGARHLERALPLWRKAESRLARRLEPRLALRLAAAAEALAR